LISAVLDSLDNGLDINMASSSCFHVLENMVKGRLGRLCRWVSLLLSTVLTLLGLFEYLWCRRVWNGANFLLLDFEN
jgi:hypothetical protein